MLLIILKGVLKIENLSIPLYVSHLSQSKNALKLIYYLKKRNGMYNVFHRNEGINSSDKSENIQQDHSELL